MHEAFYIPTVVSTKELIVLYYIIIANILKPEPDGHHLVMNPSMLNFQKKYKHGFTIAVILPYLHNTGSWNPSSCKARTHLLYIVNIMVADGVATQGAMSSATMMLTMLNPINSVPAH